VLGGADLVVYRQERNVMPQLNVVTDANGGAQIDMQRPRNERPGTDGQENPHIAGPGNIQGAQEERAHADRDARGAKKSCAGANETELRQPTGHGCASELSRVEVQLSQSYARKPATDGA
jgi:hypothetical protein